jgi:CRISPR/Cas system-associated endonuclease/helicase Cas3
MKKYYTYIINYYDDSHENEFDYFIFHTRTEKDRQKIIKEFKKLYKEDTGYKFEGHIEDVIGYKASNYPKFN